MHTVARPHRASRRSRRRRRALAALLGAPLALAGLVVTDRAKAAAALTISSITFDVIGLDSNNVTSGPDTFPVGARVCNTGDAAATNVLADFVWDSANGYFSVYGSPTITFESLPVGDCVDAYFNVRLQRDRRAYDETRPYHITATADGLGAVSTPAGRQLYVEKLVSQNRNSVQAITGPGGLGDPAPTTVVVGQTYTYKLYGSTATQGYEQLEAFIDFPNTIFRIVSVDTTYSSPTGGTNDKVHADACGFDFDPASPDYLSCVGPEQYAGGKAGGTLVSTYVVQILSAGSATMSSLIYDFSGSSFHYNSDFRLGVNAISVTAVEPAADVSIAKSDSADPVSAGSPFSYRLDVANAGPTDATGLTVTDTLPTGVEFVSAVGTGWTCSESSGTVTCSRPTLPAGAGSPITVNVTAPVTGGSITNTATVTTTSPDPVPGNDADTETTTVVGSANLSITKTDAADPVVDGDTIRYTLTASNAGPSTAVGVRVTDLLPPGTTFVSAAPSQGSCTPPAGTLTCDLGDLAAGASATVTLDVRADAIGTLSNSATVTSSTPDPDTGDNQTTETTTVEARADLSITKTDVADPVVAGEAIRYRLTIANSGPSDATGVVVTDPLPAGTTLVSAAPSQGSCGASAGVVTCSLGDLADGATATVSVVVTSSTEGVVTNAASVTSTTTDPFSANDSDSETTTVTAAADLRITKTDTPDPVTVGNPLTYTITVGNLGPSTATGVTVVDTLPASVTFGTATPSQGTCSVSGATVTCDLGSLADASSATVTIAVTPTVSGVVVNTASVSADQPDPTPGNNDDEATTVSPPATTDLRIAKVDSVDPVGVGETVDYTITIDNTSVVDATNVVVSDPLPAYLGYVSATPDQGTCSHAGGVVTCALGTIVAGGSVDVTVRALAQPGGEGTTVTNTASVAADQDDATPGDNETSESTAIAARTDLRLSITDTPDPVMLGDQVTYVLEVTNLGPSDAVAGILDPDPLPAGLIFVSVTTTQGSCSETAGDVSCSLGTVASGDIVTVTIVAVASAVGTPTYAATVSTSTVDMDATNDAAAETTTVVAAVDLGITKSDSADPVEVGAPLTYTVVVTNAGPSSATNVIVTDLLPPGVPLDTVSPSQGTCSESGGIVTCSLGTIPASGSATVIATVTPGASSAGTITNVVSVRSDQIDIDPSNDQDAETTTVAARADLALAKTNGTTTVTAGTETTYTITLTNNGPSTVDPGVVVTDTVPAGATVTGTPAGCAVSAGDVVCTTSSSLAISASVAWDVTIAVPPGYVGPTVSNVATITSTPLVDPDPSDDAATDTDSVVRSADLSVVKSAPASVAVGSDLIYDLIVRNNGPSAAHDITVVDTLPVGVSVVSTSPSCTAAAGSVTCVAGDLGVSATASFRIVVRTLPGSEGDLANSAATSGSEPDPVPSNDEDFVVTRITPIADLSITKTADASTATAGEDVGYTLEILNAGPSSATGVIVRDTLPTGLTYSTASTGCSHTSGVVTCALPELAPGERRTLSIAAATERDVARTTVNEASVASDVADPDPDNDSDTAIVDVVLDADLSIIKTGPTVALAPGDAATYRLTVRNDGPGPARGVVATDDLPSTLVFVSAGAGCSHTAGLVTCALGDLAAGGTSAVEIVTRVAIGTATGSIVNAASVASDTPDVDTVDTTSAVSSSVVTRLTTATATTTTTTTTTGASIARTGSDVLPVLWAAVITTGLGALLAGLVRRRPSSR